MKKLVWLLIFVFLPLLLAGQERVEKIEIIGNDRVTVETILYYLSIREGESYNAEAVRRDFQVLWSTGFFSNIRIEDEDGGSGKIIKIFVEENPVIKNITYKTGKRVKQDDIVNKLKEKDEYILPYAYFSPAKVQRAKDTIIALLQEKGLYAATVEVETAKKSKSEVDVAFKINEGPKVRVGEVEFVGNPGLPQGMLQEAMKTNRAHGFITWITGKDVYKENKIKEDADLIKSKYQQYGFMEATVGEPRSEEITKRTILFKTQKMIKLIFPVEAGPRYSVGDVTIDGNKAISSAYIRSVIKLKNGHIYSSKIREKSVESISEAYRNGGWLYVQVMPVESLDPKNRRVNVTYNIYEGEVAYLHRLAFRGNNYTKDKVIRREMMIREGDRFSLALFKDSMLRVKQLGLVDLEKEPDINPNPEDPTQIDAIVNVKELQRNNIQFTAGYSGYEGFFVMAGYSTVNFLGAGDNLSITLQYGKRIQNYALGITKPYIFDLPLNVGINIFSRYMIYPYLYNQASKGVDLTLGARIRGYLRGNLTYSFQDINVTQYTGGYSYYTGYYDYSGYAGYPGYGYGYGKYIVSALIPSLYRSTIDSPLTPTRGTLYLVQLKYAGGPLGGQVDFIKPRFEFTFWQPTFRRQVFGVHATYEFVSSGKGSEVPFWERFYLGGERDIRGYDIYSIGPRTADGVLMGGVKSFVFNAEYQFHIVEALNLILFYDMGNTLLKEEGFSLGKMYTSSGLEARVFVPALRVPFRLIFSYNNRLIPGYDNNHFAFRFAIGTTF